MSKILTVKCDHDCEHDPIHKSQTKKEFQDPVLETLSKELESLYHEMTESMLSQIYQVLNIPQDINKGLGGHKYVKRTGAPGHYKYWYKMPNGQLVSGDDAPEGHPHHEGDKEEGGAAKTEEVKPKKLKVTGLIPKPSKELKNALRKWGSEDAFYRMSRVNLDNVKVMDQADANKMLAKQIEQTTEFYKRINNEEELPKEISRLKREINKMVGKEIHNDDEDGDSTKHIENVKLIEHHWNSLPKAEGAAYRGLDIRPENLESFLNQHKEGMNYELKGLTSFSADQNIANDFGNILMKVNKNMDGRDVSKMTGKKHEKEILARSGTKYKIDKVTHLGGKTVIEMTELPRNAKGKIVVHGNKKTVKVKMPPKKKVVIKQDGGGLKAQPYQPITKTNLVGSADFSNVSPEAQRNFHKALNGAETIIAKMGLKLKSPIHFTTISDSTESAFAIYDPNENKIMIMDETPDSATIMHEIGHAIDLDMHEAGDNYNFNEFYDGVRDGDIRPENFTPAQNIMAQIIKEAKSSPYYKEATGKSRDYLNDPTEIFARAFEVHSYKVAEDLVNRGKLDSSFLDKFMPDLERVGSFKKTEDYAKLNAQNEDYNKKIIDAIVKKDKPTEQKLRAEQNELRLNIEAIKNTKEAEGRNDNSMGKISALVDALLKLEPIKKSLGK